MNGIVHKNGDKLWILCTQKMSAKGEKVYVTNHQMNITLFQHAHFIRPQTLNLKPYHLLHNKERFKCIKVNVGMWGDQ
jgi:hypothetical protein